MRSFRSHWLHPSQWKSQNRIRREKRLNERSLCPLTEPRIGYRAWQLKTDYAEVWRLGSMMGAPEAVWEPGRNEAHCMDYNPGQRLRWCEICGEYTHDDDEDERSAHHTGLTHRHTHTPIPDYNCGCGFWSSFTLEDLKNRCGYGRYEYVFGAVLVTGRIVEHEWGYRSQYATVVALAIRDCYHDTAIREWIPQLERYYGVRAIPELELESVAPTAVLGS